MSTADKSGSADQRAFPRTLAARKVYLGDGYAAWKCSLIDIADGGARIALARGLPSQDGLFLADPGTGLVHLTRQIWRSDREAGLQFVQTGDFVPPLGGASGAVRVIGAFGRRLRERGPL